MWCSISLMSQVHIKFYCQIIRVFHTLWIYAFPSVFHFLCKNSFAQLCVILRGALLTWFAEDILASPLLSFASLFYFSTPLLIANFVLDWDPYLLLDLQEPWYKNYLTENFGHSVTEDGRTDVHKISYQHERGGITLYKCVSNYLGLINWHDRHVFDNEAAIWSCDLNTNC